MTSTHCSLLSTRTRQARWTACTMLANMPLGDEPQRVRDDLNTIGMQRSSLES